MAIAIVDKAGRIRRSNAAFAKLLPDALKGSEAAARSIYAGVLDSDRAALEAAVVAAANAKSDIAPVDVSLRGDRNRSARLFISAADEADGPGATIYALDTTEQRTLQENFAQSQKMQAIGQLAGGVAHDFNNVLTAIIGYSDLLLANHRPTDPSFQDIMQIKQNANRAAGLVRQLLAFSRRQTLAAAGAAARRRAVRSADADAPPRRREDRCSICAMAAISGSSRPISTSSSR